MSEFVEFLALQDAQGNAISGEPVTIEEVKTHARWDLDNTIADDQITSVYIPGARQLAESRTGSAIRPARFIQRLQEFPKDGGAFAITHGLVMDIESITYLNASGARQTLDPASYADVIIDRETLVEPVGGKWPDTSRSLRAVEVTYTAGILPADLAARYASVRHFILMACAWALEQPELFVLSKGKQGYQELPGDYLAGLLDPITLRTRF